jgi:dephospho-CoA kinase
MNVVALVGMPGAGKSEVAGVFEKAGYKRIRFGDITDEEVAKRGLPLNEENERRVREQLRTEHGMAAYAKLNIPKIDAALKSANVIVDGLYSWEEYKLLKSKYGKDFKVVAVWASPAARSLHLGTRKIRPLTPEEAAARDYAEIEKINKGGPIAMADYTVLNNSSLANLKNAAEKVLAELK